MKHLALGHLLLALSSHDAFCMMCRLDSLPRGGGMVGLVELVLIVTASYIITAGAFCG